MKPEFLPQDRDGRLFRLIEEMGEVAQAIGKAGRFGMSNRCPRTGVSNAEAIVAELSDLRHAIDAVVLDLTSHGREAHAS